MHRPRLLFLSHRLPYPPHNGAAIRTYNVLRLLARHYDITALCFDRGDAATAHLSLEERLTATEPLGRFTAYPIPQEKSRLRLVWDHVRSVATHRAYTYFVHDSRAFMRALERELTTHAFDLVHVDSLDLVRHLRFLPVERTVLTHHNTESQLLGRRADGEHKLYRRGYLRWQAQLLREAEREWLPRVALNAVVSDADRRELASVAPTARFCVVPNGVDTAFFAPSPQRRSGIVFVGGTSYFPNADALRWFYAEILPALRRRGCHEEVSFIGRATAEEVSRYSGREGIRLTGYVDDIRPLVDAAACFIAPLRIGGGTRLKIVDAWAMGKAVVSTTVGAEGLAATDGQNILLRDDPESFAAAIVRVIEDVALRERLERCGRQTAESVYSWDVIERSMIGDYEKVRLAAGAMAASERRASRCDSGKVR